MARGRKSGRNVDGIVLLDKPLEMGSNEALQIVKRLFHARKAGHTGSLDRLASGLLPLCMGEATKLSGFLLNADKRYQAVFRLGVTTTTGDAEGEVMETRPVPEYSELVVRQTLDRFVGEVTQIPPMHSAIKHQGQRLYKLAHQGIVVEREPRTITIFELELVGRSSETLEVKILCSKGTYIRTLAEDVGKSLGCGASVASLHRVGSGPFTSDGMHTLEALRDLAKVGREAVDSVLLPMESALEGWPEVSLMEDVAFYMRQGQPVMVPHAPVEGWVKIYRKGRRFLGVGEVLEDGRIAPRRLINSGK